MVFVALNHGNTGAITLFAEMRDKAGFKFAIPVLLTQREVCRLTAILQAVATMEKTNNMLFCVQFQFVIAVIAQSQQFQRQRRCIKRIGFTLGYVVRRLPLVRQRDYFFKMTDPAFTTGQPSSQVTFAKKVSRPNNVYPWFGRQANTTIYQLPFPSSTKSA